MHKLILSIPKQDQEISPCSCSRLSLQAGAMSWSGVFIQQQWFPPPPTRWYMKDNGQGNFFVKVFFFLYKILFLHWGELRLGKNHRSSNNLNCLRNSCNTTLYLVDVFGFSPTFGLFLNAKLPSYKSKRVRSDRLAGTCNRQF